MFGYLERIPHAESIVIYERGNAICFDRRHKVFAEIQQAWSETTEQAFPMPAFGVSFDRLTREEMKSGLWLEFVFSQVQCGEDSLPFEKLLIGVRPEYHGFNLVRFYDGGYNGRCFYLDLRERTMLPLYRALETVLQRERPDGQND